MNLDTVKNKITTVKKVYDKKNEYPVDCEFTLPDYCPDIERILKCNITPLVSNLSVLSDSASVELTAEICVLYATKEDKLFGYEMPINLSKSINIGNIEKEAIKDFSTALEYVNCRAVNNRKIDIHGSVSVLLKLFTDEDKGFLSNINDDTIVLKKQNEKVLKFVGTTQKQVSIADDIIITGASGSVSNIINHNACITVDECKTLPGKMIVKLTVYYKILYLSTDYRYECIKHSVPVTQVVDLSGVDENSVCNVKANICSVSLKPITNSEGEMRTINSSAKIGLNISAFNQTDVNIITDGYSVKYESELEKDNINCISFKDLVNEKITVSECVELSSQISEVIDINCTPLHYNCKLKNGSTYINGDIAIMITLIDDNNCCRFYEKVVSYSEKISSHESDDICKFNLTLTPLDCSYNISSNNAVDFKCEMHISGIITKSVSINAVTSMMLDEEKEKSYDDMPSLVVYYATSGEDIWDIALKYNTSADKIKETNNIDTDVLSADKMLLIPCL